MSPDVKTNENGPAQPLEVERVVSDRYSAASKDAQPALCCPIEYDSRFLEILPDEILQRDYGCGDPSKYVSEGETVLDLGSGGGKICYIAAQVVGENGRVIGVDMNEDMLALARKYQPSISDQLGFDNVDFHKGRIQDLALDLDQFDTYLREHPVESAADWQRADAYAGKLRAEQPMVTDDSVDVVVSNCVLNLIDPQSRQQLFSEMHRVLRRGGRAVISDIVCDEPVPQQLKEDPELWSGCISGAYIENEFLDAFAEAGFYGIEILSLDAKPWATVEGIEFRSMTVRAYKGKEGPCLDLRQGVIYRGPWKAVFDDDGNTLYRGERTAVCEKNFDIYTQAPYAEVIEPVPPHDAIDPHLAQAFDCSRDSLRDPRETKGQAYDETQLPQEDGCSGESCC